MDFRYTAAARDDRVVSGIIHAHNESLAEDRLRQEGLKVVAIRPARAGRFRRFIRLGGAAVSRGELATFSHQLAILLNAGTPLLTALQLLRDQARTQVFKETVDDLVAELRGGSALHGAMEKHPESFPPVYVRLVEAGEKSGTLEKMLRHLSEYIQKEAAALQQAKKALTYPTIVLVVGMVVLGIMVTVVLPSMAQLLASFRVDLPLTSRVVIAFSEVVQAWKLHALAALGVVLGVSAWYFRRPKGQLQWGRAMLRAPWWGKLTIRRSMGRFSRIMSLLLGAGLPAPDALLLARDSSSNQYFRSAMADAREQVIQGRSMAQALGTVPFVPGLFIQMVRAGEESGVLEGNLAAMAELFEKDVDEQLATMAAFLEPAITIAMGIGVALMALAVMQPMFSLIRNVQ